MRHRRHRILPLILLALTAAGSVPILSADRAEPHEFTLDAVMNAFVEIEPHQAHIVIRVPLYLFKSVKFPLQGRELDLDGAGPAVQRALAALDHELVFRENGRRLAASSAAGRLTLPSDRSFEQYETAAAHVAQPIAPGTTIYADQGYFDAHLTYAIGSPTSVFTIRTDIAPELKDALKLAIRYLPLDQDSRVMVITSRSGEVALNPTWYRAIAVFVALGIVHILSGLDHLLFLVCLVIPLRGFREILGVVTAFTAAHSVTLLASGFRLAPEGTWFPPLVEAMIAASIVYMALENIAGADLRRRWLITGLFGLVHGFGFSYALKDSLQFAGRHLLVSLFSFNLGIEIGQMLVLAVLLPALALLLAHVLARRIGVILLSALVAHVGWHWMTDRADALWKVPWPAIDGTALGTLARWIAGVLLIAGGLRLIVKWIEGGHRPVRTEFGAGRPAILGTRIRAGVRDALSRVPPLGVARKRSGP